MQQSDSSSSDKLGRKISVLSIIKQKKVLPKTPEKRRTIQGTNPLSFFQELSTQKKQEQEKKNKKKAIVDQMKKDITNMLNSQNGYLLYMDRGLAPDQRYRGRFPSPGERVKDQMTNDYDQLTNKEHYRRRSCMCETCGLLTNTVIQRLDEKAPPKMIPKQFLYVRVKKKKEKLIKKKQKLIAPFLKKKKNNLLNIRNSNHDFKGGHSPMRSQGKKQLSFLMRAEQKKNSQKLDEQGVVGGSQLLGTKTMIKSLPNNPQRRSLFVGASSQQQKPQNNLLAVDNSQRIGENLKRMSFFQNARKSIQQLSISKTLDQEGINRIDSGKNPEEKDDSESSKLSKSAISSQSDDDDEYDDESEEDDSQSKTSHRESQSNHIISLAIPSSHNQSNTQHSNTHRMDNSDKKQSPKLVANSYSPQKQRNNNKSPIQSPLQSPNQKRGRNNINNSSGKNSRGNSPKNNNQNLLKVQKPKKKKKQAKKSPKSSPQNLPRPQFLKSLMEKVEEQDRKNKENIQLYTKLFTVSEPVLNKEKGQPKHKFEKFLNKLSYEQYVKKQQKYQDEMGDDYYQMLQYIGEEDFDKLIQESDSEEEQLIYQQKKNQVIKIPHVKNQITRCFLDMYKIRPNTTVTNYVSVNKMKTKPTGFLSKLIDRNNSSQQKSRNQEQQQNQNQKPFKSMNQLSDIEDNSKNNKSSFFNNISNANNNNTNNNENNQAIKLTEESEDKTSKTNQTNNNKILEVEEEDQQDRQQISDQDRKSLQSFSKLLHLNSYLNKQESQKNEIKEEQEDEDGNNLDKQSPQPRQPHNREKKFSRQGTLAEGSKKKQTSRRQSILVKGPNQPTLLVHHSSRRGSVIFKPLNIQSVHTQSNEEEITTKEPETNKFTKQQSNIYNHINNINDMVPNYKQQPYMNFQQAAANTQDKTEKESEVHVKSLKQLHEDFNFGEDYFLRKHQKNENNDTNHNETEKQNLTFRKIRSQNNSQMKFQLGASHLSPDERSKMDYPSQSQTSQNKTNYEEQFLNSYFKNNPNHQRVKTSQGFKTQRNYKSYNHLPGSQNNQRSESNKKYQQNLTNIETHRNNNSQYLLQSSKNSQSKSAYRSPQSIRSPSSAYSKSNLPTQFGSPSISKLSSLNNNTINNEQQQQQLPQSLYKSSQNHFRIKSNGQNSNKQLIKQQQQQNRPSQNYYNNSNTSSSTNLKPLSPKYDKNFNNFYNTSNSNRSSSQNYRSKQLNNYR